MNIYLAKRVRTGVTSQRPRPPAACPEHPIHSTTEEAGKIEDTYVRTYVHTYVITTILIIIISIIFIMYAYIYIYIYTHTYTY